MKIRVQHVAVGLLLTILVLPVVSAEAKPATKKRAAVTVPTPEPEAPAPPAPVVDEKSALMAEDMLMTVHDRSLLLRAVPPKNETNMPPKVFKFLLESIEQSRFDIHTWKPDSQPTKTWCISAAEDAQIKAGDQTLKGQGRVSMDVLLKLCSGVATYAFTARHSCEHPKKDTYECSVQVEIDVKKYKAVDAGNGTIKFVEDQSFGTRGVEHIEAVGFLPGLGAGSTIAEALVLPSFMAKLMAERKVRDIPMFQLQAPIAEHRPLETFFCLGRDSVELDTPFHVLKRTADGVERVGFVKARELYDGCDDTPMVRQRAKEQGRELMIRPSLAQDILGTTDIMAGMTAHEMPSIGLNVGVTTGFSMLVNRALGGHVGVLAEYDLARHINVSEFYVTLGVWATLANPGPVNDKIKSALGVASGSSKVATAIGGDAGVLKRFFVVGPLFFDIGAGFAWDAYAVAASDKGKLVMGSVGVNIKGAIGFQVDPRILLRLVPGFHYGYVTGKLEGGSNTFIGNEVGGIVAIEGLYNL